MFHKSALVVWSTALIGQIRDLKQEHISLTATSR